MAKALKTAVVAAIAIYIPAAALKLGASFSVTLFGSTLTGATALAVTTFATTLDRDWETEKYEGENR